MTIAEAEKKLRDKLAAVDKVPDGIGSGGEWGFDKEAVRVLLIGYGELRRENHYIKCGNCYYCKRNDVCTERRGTHKNCWVEKRGPEPGGEG